MLPAPASKDRAFAHIQSFGASIPREQVFVRVASLAPAPISVR